MKTHTEFSCCENHTKVPREMSNVHGQNEFWENFNRILGNENLSAKTDHFHMKFINLQKKN